MLERFGVARCCCDQPSVPGCIINSGWRAPVKNGLTNSDLAAGPTGTDWTIEGGTWNGVKLPIPQGIGVEAEALETTSSNARIVCDDEQAQPNNGRVELWHCIGLEHPDDEAYVWLAGKLFICRYNHIEMPDGTLWEYGGLGLMNPLYGYGSGRYFCSWFDDDLNAEYVGCHALGWNGGRSIKLGVSSGSAAFGTGNVRGRVSFQHRSIQNGIYYDGYFTHNTVRTDGSELDCRSCFVTECPTCPGSQNLRYLAVTISGLQNGDEHPVIPETLGGDSLKACEECGQWDGTYVFDLQPATTLSSRCGEYYALGSFCENFCLAGICCPAEWTISVAAGFEETGPGRWRVYFSIGEAIKCDPYNYTTAGARYVSSEFTSGFGCEDIDSLPLSLDRKYEDRTPMACKNYDGLTVTATAYD